MDKSHMRSFFNGFFSALGFAVFIYIIGSCVYRGGFRDGTESERDECHALIRRECGPPS